MLKNTVSVLIACSIFAGVARAQDDASKMGSSRPVVSSKPIPLDWRSITWPSFDYGRKAIPGGAALYTIPSSSAQKFRVEFIFAGGIYTFSEEQRVALGAAVDLVLLGGAGARSFDQLSNFLESNGISIATDLLNGHFIVRAEALPEDFPTVVKLLEDVLLRPRFDKDAIDLWKQEQTDQFESILDASSISKQRQFVMQESVRLGFGDDHFFGKALQRRSKKAVSAVSYDDAKKIAKQLVSRTGLNVVLTGTYAAKDEKSVEALIAKLPRTAPQVKTWMPARSSVNPTKKIRIGVIRKKDMTQSLIAFRYIYPKAGLLNEIEETRLQVLEEVFSASGGVVGSDRFSKAMRADSGISYFAHADYTEKFLFPNTNAGLWAMSYQSPNERIVESIKLARKTWEDYAGKGITQEELERARTSRMNAILAKEETVFDKAETFSWMLTEGDMLSPTYLESDLVQLEGEKTLNPVNATLSHITAQDAIPVLVMMGNPSDETIAALKADADLDVVKVVDFENMVKELQ